MTIRKRLLFTSLAAGLLLALMIFFTMVSLDRVITIGLEISRVEQAMLSFEKTHRAMEETLLLQGLVATIDSLKTNMGSFEHDLQALKKNISSFTKTTQNIGRVWKSYKRELGGLLRLNEIASDNEDALIIFVELVELGDIIHSDFQQLLVAIRLKAEKHISTTKTWMLWWSIFVFFAILLSLYALYRRIVPPLGQLSQTMNEVEKSGDLSTYRVQHSAGNEVGTAAQAFDHLVDSWEKIIADINLVLSGYADKRFNIPITTQIRGDLGTLAKNINHTSAALKKITGELQQAQRMESIGLMAGGVAHDLNNILSGIVGYPDLMLQNLPGDSPLRQPIETIQESGKRAATVVADLLAVAKGAASTREPYDLNALIREYLNSPEHIQLQANHPHIICNYKFHASLSTVSCSPVHVKKCIMNLIANSVEAMKGVGNVTVSTENKEIDTDMGIKWNTAPGEYIVVNVEDTGPGIADDDLEHIFEPFYSQKILGRSGTGLGLTVVWNTMTDHGGKVLVESGGKGTCFQLFFPLNSQENIVRDSDETVNIRSSNNKQILVVDDEEQLRDLADQMLASLGYIVHSVPSGEKALEFLKDKEVDLILLDMLMDPGMNGRQTYEEILRNPRGATPELRAKYYAGWAYYKMGNEKRALAMFEGIVARE